MKISYLSKKKFVNGIILKMYVVKFQTLVIYISETISTVLKGSRLCNISSKPAEEELPLQGQAYFCQSIQAICPPAP
jgi:hypothetical protein